MVLKRTILPVALPAVLSMLAVCAVAQPPPYLHAPAVTEYARHDPKGTTILPDGRLLKPIGAHYPLARWPHGLAMTRDGKTLFVASAGAGQLVTDWDTRLPGSRRSLPEAGGGRRRGANGGGAAFSPDGSTLYWSGGDTGEIYVFDVAKRQQTGEISLNVEIGGRKYADSFAMDVKASADGADIYCADVTNFRVVVIDCRQAKVVGSAGVGRYPYALAVAGQRVYVANIGHVRIQPDPAARRARARPRGLTFPPFGCPAKRRATAYQVEGREFRASATRTRRNPSRSGASMSPTRRTRTVIAGSRPGCWSARRPTAAKPSAAAHRTTWWPTATRSTSPTATTTRSSAIDLATGKIDAARPDSPVAARGRLRGVGPRGMAVSPDGPGSMSRRSGINAIGVLDTRHRKVLGHIPTAWYPYRVALSPDGKKLPASASAASATARTRGKRASPTDPFLGMQGVSHVLDVPSDGRTADA